MAEKNVMDVLRERGFIAQTVYEDELYKMLGEEDAEVPDWACSYQK